MTESVSKRFEGKDPKITPITYDKVSAKKYWRMGELDGITTIALNAADPNKLDKDRPPRKPPVSGLGKCPYWSFWNTGNDSERPFSLETDPYFRVKDIMDKASDLFLEKKYKQRLKGIHVLVSLPKAKDADGLGCLVS